MNDTATRFRPAGLEWTSFRAQHFLWRLDGKVATITLNRPERKNPLTLESYAELRDTFRNLLYADTIKAVVVTGAGGNFCSGGDVHEIIGPLVEMQRNGDMAGLLAFTRMTGDLVKAMRACPQPIVAAIDGVCAGAGAILAMASDLRYGTARSKVAFLFVRVGLAGADSARDRRRNTGTHPAVGRLQDEHHPGKNQRGAGERVRSELSEKKPVERDHAGERQQVEDIRRGQLEQRREDRALEQPLGARSGIRLRGLGGSRE